MAKRFTKDQWDKIERELSAKPSAYGMPEGGREESVVLASFNIRKLGASKNRARELAFMARFCARLVDPHEAGVADHVGGQNCGQPALHKPLPRRRPETSAEAHGRAIGRDC